MTIFVGIGSPLTGKTVFFSLLWHYRGGPLQYEHRRTLPSSKRQLPTSIGSFNSYCVSGGLINSHPPLHRSLRSDPCPAHRHHPPTLVRPLLAPPCRLPKLPLINAPRENELSNQLRSFVVQLFDSNVVAQFSGLSCEANIIIKKFYRHWRYVH